MHQRDRHFLLGGSELTSPQYVYFEKLSFMRKFSIKKDPPLEASFHDVVMETDISPDQLLYEDGKDSETTEFLVDYTEKFLSTVKNYPILYDEQSEMRKYRSKDAWKEISEQLGGKFTVGKLRLYWLTLMKKYKLYLGNPHLRCRTIANETIFDLLSFAGAGLQDKNAMNNGDQFIMSLDNEMDTSRDYVEDVDEEHLLCEEVGEDDHTLEESEVEQEQDQLIDEITQAVESIEEFNADEPVSKRVKLEPELPQVVVCRQEEPCQVIPQPIQCTLPSVPQALPLAPAALQMPQLSSTAEDEFDYFGKKVALQLRNLAQRSRNVAHKGEIKVLQLLMELEESLDS